MKRRNFLFYAVAGGFSSGLLRAGSKKGPRKLPGNDWSRPQRAEHLLNRLGYGPRPGDVERLVAQGERAWIESQLDPASIPDDAFEQRVASYSTLTMSTGELLALFPQFGAVRRLVEGGELDPDQVRGLPGLDRKMAVRFDPLDWEVHRLDEPVEPPKRGNVRLRGRPIEGVNPQTVVTAQLQAAKLTRAVASERQLQALMADFWFNHFNVFAGKQQSRLLLTEYERDVILPNAFGKFRTLLGAVAHSPAMLTYLDHAQSFGPDSALGKRRKKGLNENYARELMELHTLGVDGGYTQSDVTEAARVLTGWTVGGPGFDDDSFHFLEPAHDTGVKTILGESFEPTGRAEGERLLDLLAEHPSTARFLAQKLVRRFVADEPPPKLVDAVAAAYQRTDGDISAMLRAIFYSKEFWADDAYRAKTKKPLELVASTIRALGSDFQATTALLKILERMGEPLYLCQPPTGYADVAEAWTGGDALVSRWNFALMAARGRTPGVSPPDDLAPIDTAAPDQALDALASRYLQTPLEAESQQRLLAAVGDLTPRSGPYLLGLVLASPEFQRR
ncbi:MAG: DUF1800 family protein [Acidobacteria bacterium]|nr:DUF1800 family protein [Acidobacteriota bacterium]